MAVFPRTFHTAALRCRLRILDRDECEDDESQEEYAHRDVHDRVHISDDSILGHGTDKRTHEHRGDGTEQRIECTSYLDELVAFLTAASEKVQHRIHYRIENTYRETCHECAEKIYEPVGRKTGNGRTDTDDS